MHVLIAGAGGPLGRRLVNGYLRRGNRVTAISYSGQGFEGLRHPRLVTLARDVTKPAGLAGLCRGVDMVVSSLGITRSRRHHLTHMDVDYRGNLNLLREAEQAQVKKFVFVTPIGAQHGDEHGVPLLRAKALFKKELRQSGIDWLIFRTGGFFQDLAEMGRMAANGTMYVVGSGASVFTPVDVDDVARIMVDDSLTARNAIIEIGGPEDMSWNQIVEACFAHYGLKPRIVRVPVWACQALLVPLRLFAPAGYAMGKLIVYMSTHDLPTARRGTLRFADYLATRPAPEPAVRPLPQRVSG